MVWHRYCSVFSCNLNGSMAFPWVCVASWGTMVHNLGTVTLWHIFLFSLLNLETVSPPFEPSSHSQTLVPQFISPMQWRISFISSFSYSNSSSCTNFPVPLQLQNIYYIVKVHSSIPPFINIHCLDRVDFYLCLHSTLHTLLSWQL